MTASVPLRASVLCAAALCLAAAPVRPQESGRRLAGQVVDISGAPVPRAAVRLRVPDAPAVETETGADGRFELPNVLTADATLQVDAPGFATTTATVPAAQSDRPVRIVLTPAPLAESVTVTASRSVEPLATPAATSLVTSAELLNAPAGALDDILRATPGFSLFRRSSSRVANPTTQGVTLRGLAASGASRTLVLADGFPLNDPFGSWVYWDRVPQAAIERVEVVRGATGDLYGPDALGGVIQVLTFRPGRPQLRAVADAGSRGTGRVSLFAAGRRGAWSVGGAGEWLESDGAHVVSRADRGKVDVPAESDHRTAFVTIGYDGEAWRAGVRGSLFSERRGNGTPLQVNDTDARQVSAELSGPVAGGAWISRAAGGTQGYDQAFSAVAADRASERLTTEQQIPTSFVSGGGEWVRSWGAHAVLLGAEGRRVESEVNQTSYSFTGVPSRPAPFGGTETSLAAFGRASLVVAGRVSLIAGARVERWTSTPQLATQPSHANAFVSPRVSLAWPMGRGVSARAALYRAYRTPTLNELHRGFRVGNIVTNANPSLDPERLTGVEAGLLLAGRRASARVSGFWTHLDEAITNVTLTVTPSLITRERQNAERVRSAGIELEADARPHRTLRVSVVAVFTSSRFRASATSAALEGHRVPQIPRYQLGASVTYTDPRTLTGSAQVRVVGAQFDDDLNEFRLDPFAVLDAYAGRTLGRGLHLFAAIENVLDEEYDVGRTPVRTVGWPRTVRVGVRLFLP